MLLQLLNGRSGAAEMAAVNGLGGYAVRAVKWAIEQEKPLVHVHAFPAVKFEGSHSYLGSLSLSFHPGKPTLFPKWSVKFPERRFVVIDCRMR